MSNVRLIHHTPDAEKLISYIARVSNPDNQDNPDYKKLIKYLIKNKHWSPFEMVSICVEIKTSRDIEEQIIRHRSFSFQIYSQRYSEILEIEPIEIRKQAVKNRQSSEEIFDPDLVLGADYPYYASEAIQDHMSQCKWLYGKLIQANVAKEVAREVMPMASSSTIYMHGTFRSFIHYLSIRNDEHAQKEHRLIAIEIENILRQLFPIVFAALDEIKAEETFKNDVYNFLKERNISSIDQLKDLLQLPL